jgi:hypothetical protein
MANTETPACNLTQHGIKVTDIRRNLWPAALDTEAIREDRLTRLRLWN